MIVGRFLLWARFAPAGQRAQAVAALTRAYLAGDLGPADAAEAETALTSILDDPAPCVRLAMAEALAASPGAPRHVVVALAADQPEIASIVLAHSPLLDEADLVDCAALGDTIAQVAIASRRTVPVGVSAALAEIGSAAALVALARNEGSALADASLARILARHGDKAAVREALLTRRHLPVEISQAIAAAIAASLSTFVVGCGWLSAERTERVTRDSRDRATVALSAGAEAEDLVRLVQHLRRSGQLTATLLLRALLSGNRPFFAAALADLTGRPERRVAAILDDRRPTAFRALYDQTGLPSSLRPALEAAHAALAADPAAVARPGEARLSCRLVEQALAACRSLPSAEGRRLAALLRRFDVEAARTVARDRADAMADGAALRFVLENAPETLILEDRAALAA